MTKFEPYNPTPVDRGESLEISIKGLETPQELDRVAEITAQRSGKHLEATRIQLEKEKRSGQRSQVFVAMSGDHVVGFGRIKYLDEDLGPLKGKAPSGWYFLGTVVDEGHRRLGVGSALSNYRSQYLEAQGVLEVYSFCNRKNLTSVDFHRRNGFEEVLLSGEDLERWFGHSGGMLFRKALAS